MNTTQTQKTLAFSRHPLSKLALGWWTLTAYNCSNQDAKYEFGWDDFQAIKYKAWEHHLALTIMANWFINETRLEWT
jgi:hypothetical protein